MASKRFIPKNPGLIMDDASLHTYFLVVTMHLLGIIKEETLSVALYGD